ncbi:hypothetical protein KO498_04115 [Lentibacter algarum]|uniref:DUF2946 family protein n=1 Tax=Lentibacter algarum TaxID=576131 RepID=UPI001C072F0C|nr:DUF2946 family protein [Lentibacter algarum]MBU2980993.1 hypothetical protein [Lentibacter algarum]
MKTSDLLLSGWGEGSMQLLETLKQNAPVRLLKCVLLLALIMAGAIPVGFMRIATTDGMKLVLCTSDGPTEVWMTDEGDVIDSQPVKHQPEDQNGCATVVLSLVMVQAWITAVSSPVEFSVFRLEHSDQRAALVALKSPQQPRAPPITI